MGKKNHKKTIRSLTQRIEEHQEKIRIEEEKDYPDEGLIKHWQTEIKAFEKGIQQAQKRLGK
jgi:peptidoglycan hydrolase CwlO-like protein